MLVDTGLGLPDAGERWAAELEQLDAPVVTLLVTHFHPDHLGAAADVRDLTGSRVCQGAVDALQARLVWENEEWSQVLVGWFGANGVPAAVTEELIGQGLLYRPFIRAVGDPELVAPGDELHGWEVVAAPGHADGQLTLLKDGILIAADHLLARITPTVGLWPASRPDPLGDYLDALERTIELAPEIAYGGHGDTVTDPVGSGPRADRAPRRAPPPRRRGARARAADRLRGVVPALRRRSPTRSAQVRSCRDALPSRAARPGRQGDPPRGESRRRRRRLLYCREVVGELPSSTAAPETGA